MIYMVGTFNYNETAFTPEAAERHYLEYHVPLARQLPGLRRYTIGRLVETRTIAAERHRGAILAFDSVEALRDAYRSPVGVELRADEQRLLRDPRALLIGGQDVPVTASG